MRLLFWGCLTFLATLASVRGLVATNAADTCTVTTAPEPAFIPPVGYAPAASEDAFWYGSNSLWTIIVPHKWRAGGNDGAKLVYWREGYNWREDHGSPYLFVVAHRIDTNAPLVWSDGASGVRLSNDDTPGGMSMMTGIDIPTPGCWEISAHYQTQTLTYTVLVEQ
jgi:hypothetical protein